MGGSPGLSFLFPVVSFVVPDISPWTDALNTGLCQQLRVTQKQETQRAGVSQKYRVPQNSTLSA